MPEADTAAGGGAAPARASPRWITLLALAPVLLALCAYLLFPSVRLDVHEGISLLLAGDLPGLRDWAAGFGPWAPLATSALMVLQAIAAPIPAILITWTNSLLFGPFLGGVLSITSATFAALVCFYLARALGEPLVSRLVPPHLRERTDRFMEEHGASAVLVSRLLPFVPFDPISFAAGLTGMRASTFAWATLVGQIPAGMAYSYLAEQSAHPLRLLALAPAVFLALVVIGVMARRIFLSRRG